MSYKQQRQIARELGYADSIIDMAFRHQNSFINAGELVDYLYLYEDRLTQKVIRLEKWRQEEKEKKLLEEKKKLEKLRYETARLHSQTLCLICGKKQRTLVNLPCAHYCLCRLCGDFCKICPIDECKMPILAVVNTFLA